MQILASKDNSSGKVGKNITLFLSGIFMTLIINILFYFSVLNFQIVLFLVAVVFTTISLFSFDLTIFLFFATLFTHFIIYYLAAPVLFVIPVALSFFINFKNSKFDELKSPAFIGLGIYVISIIPSYFNSVDLKLSLFLTTNLVSMILIHYIIVGAVKDTTDIKRYFNLYLLLVALNSVIVIVLSILNPGKRVYGIPGIVYVDYASIGIIGLVITIILKKKNLVFYLLLLIFIVASLIFTQTRNVLISLALTLVILVTYLFMKSKKIGFKKSAFIKYIVIFSLVSVTVVEIILVYKPDSFTRIMETVDEANNSAAYKDKLVVSSVTTRFLLWHTALMVFQAHPFVGAGAFAFPSASAIYTKVPKVFYKEYVEGLSPHLTFLANLSETGVLGFCGFLFLLYICLRNNIVSISKSVSSEEIYVSVMLLFLQVYIIFSMFLTDAWLWGQCGMLWGVVIGLSSANYKNLVRNSEILKKE